MTDVILENIVIREATLADVEALTDLSYQTFKETFAHLNSVEDMQMYYSKSCTKDVLEEELRERSSVFLLAHCEHEPVGFSKLRWSEIPYELNGQNPIEIQRLYVLKNVIGKKIGKALIEDCFEIARKKTFDIIWLGVWKHNDRAISFYKKFGFEVFGSQIFELGRDKQTDLLMKKVL